MTCLTKLLHCSQVFRPADLSIQCRLRSAVWSGSAQFALPAPSFGHITIWAASSEFDIYRICEQRRFRRACASAQSRQNLRCLLIQALSQEEPSDRKPDSDLQSDQGLHSLLCQLHRLDILLYGPRQANLIFIAYASSEGSGEPAHPRSLARTSAACSYKHWVKRNLQTESQIPSPSEWLGMRS